jgi:hypothetical protein
LGDRHPCSRWYILEKFTEVGNWGSPLQPSFTEWIRRKPPDTIISIATP